MASQSAREYISSEQYLELERTSEHRSEYISGEILAMAFPSKAHARIVANLAWSLHNSLDAGPCEVSVGLSVSAPASYLVPDLVVYCKGGEFSGNDILLDPVVVFEVLSSSTSDFDHGQKWMRYQRINSLMHYVLISQYEPRVEVFSRMDDGSWHYVAVRDLSQEVFLGKIGVQLPLAQIYEGVELKGEPDFSDVEHVGPLAV